MISRLAVLPLNEMEGTPFDRCQLIPKDGNWFGFPPKNLRLGFCGIIKPPATIYRTSLPPRRGWLFCGLFFGPVDGWCGCCRYYRRRRYRVVGGRRCVVLWPLSKVRRERMGHIELAAPVSHIWYFKGIPLVWDLF